MRDLFKNCEYPDPVYGELVFPENSDDRNETLEKNVQNFEVSNEILRKNLECMEKEHSELIKKFDLMKSELMCDISKLKVEHENQRLKLHAAHNEVETIRNENDQLRVWSTGLSHQVSFHMKDRHQGHNHNIRTKPIKDSQDEPPSDSLCIDDIDEIDKCQKALSEVLLRIKRRNEVQDYSELVHSKSMIQSMKLAVKSSPIINSVSEIASSTVEKLQIIFIAFLETSLKTTMTIANYVAKSPQVALIIFIVIMMIYLSF